LDQSRIDVACSSHFENWVPSMSAMNLDTDILDISSLEYVDQDAASNFECPLCMSVFNDPVLVCSHEHHMCRSCALHQRETCSECPTCRSRLHISEGQRFLRNMLDGLQVHCVNRARGCDVTMERKDLKKHISKCGFSLVKCPHCTTMMERHELFSQSSRHWHCDAARYGCEFLGQSDADVSVHLADCVIYKCRARFEEYDRRLAEAEEMAPPVGSMLAWTGTRNQLPRCWALCDGQQGRPNRVREFVEERSRSGQRRHFRRSSRRSCSRRRWNSRSYSRRSRSMRRWSLGAPGETRSERYELAYIVRVPVDNSARDNRSAPAGSGG